MRPISHLSMTASEPQQAAVACSRMPVLSRLSVSKLRGYNTSTIAITITIHNSHFTVTSAIDGGQLCKWWGCGIRELEHEGDAPREGDRGDEDVSEGEGCTSTCAYGAGVQAGNVLVAVHRRKNNDGKGTWPKYHPLVLYNIALRRNAKRTIWEITNLACIGREVPVLFTPAPPPHRPPSDACSDSG